LNVKPLSSADDIKKGYLALCKRYHTDNGGDEDMIKKINWAYEILSEYIKNYRFSFTEDEIIRQYPGEFNKKFRI